MVQFIAPEQPIDPVVGSAERSALTPAVVEEVTEAAPPPIAPPTISKAVEAPKKAPRKRVPRARLAPVPVAADELEVPPLEVPPLGVATGPTAPDDLAALEAENKRLRQLLADRLRSENVELRRMLERF